MYFIPIQALPTCSAHLIERAGFKLAFMSGFSVSATRLAAPDAGLISYGEMVEQVFTTHGTTILQDAFVTSLAEEIHQYFQTFRQVAF